MTIPAQSEPAARERRHRQRLLELGRCPACAEVVSAATFFRGGPCPRCGSTIDLAHRDEPLVDVLTRRGRRQLVVVCALVACAHLLLGWIPLLEALTLVLAAMWLRWGITIPAARAMSPARRIVATWTARLLVAVLLAVTLVLAQLVMLLGPLVLPLKALLGLAQVAGSAALLTTYLHWQLRREANGRAVGAIEWVVLALSAGALLGAVVALGLALFFVLRALEWALVGLGGGLAP